MNKFQKLLTTLPSVLKKRGTFVVYTSISSRYKITRTQYLLSYRFLGEDLELIIIGPHENYYRDVKSYLKSR